MSNYVITESVGSRVERVNSYADLEKHHPSSGREPGRDYLTINGELEEVRLNRAEPHVKKDFILDPPTIPSPVSGYIRNLNDTWNTVQIVDAQGTVLAQSLHMERGSQPPNGTFVEYGQTIGRMGDVGSPGSVHAHVEAPARVFEQYINDMASGRIQPGQTPDGRTNPAQGNVDPLADGLLNRGDRGPKVEELQRVLTQRGYDTQGTDGVFGQNTETAVRAFQTANNLAPVDGIVGADTARALGIRLSDAQAPQPPTQPQPPTTPEPPQPPQPPTTPGQPQPPAHGRVPGGPNDFGPSNPLGALISSGEGGYGSFNRGRAGDADGATIDFSQMTIGEVMRRQGLPNGHPDELFAVGKYQMIPDTLRETVGRLGIDQNERLTPQLQERMFADYLIDEKRPQVRAYITGQTGGAEGLQDAQLALAREFASIADPRTGRSVYDGDSAGNSASITADQVGRALNQMREQYQENVRAGASPSEAYRALSGDPTQPFVDRALDPLSDGVLNRGDRGPKVEELQRVLTQRGYDTQGTDGVFGQNTETAVRAFQTANNLAPVDGIVGADTARALGIRLTETQPQPQPDTPAPQPNPPAPPGNNAPAPTDPVAPSPAPPTSAQPVPAGVYREGDNGEGVRALQEALNRNGAQLDADGRFGPRTEAAVMAYQRQNGLDVDGVAGAQTIGRLNQGLQQTPPAPNTPDTPAPTPSPTPDGQTQQPEGRHWPTPGNTRINTSQHPIEGEGEFRTPRSNDRGYHTGVDVEGKVGDPIVAMEGGRVTYAGPRGTAGNTVIIDHGNGLETRYMHLDSIPSGVRVGTQVEGGQQIGTMGRTGNTPDVADTHLHFEVRRNGEPVNPRDFLNFPPRDVLRQGDEGRDVQTLQEGLRRLGATTLQADGDFGPATRGAVEDFQRRNNLEPDGIAGPATQRELTRQLQQLEQQAAPVQPQAATPAMSDIATAQPEARGLDPKLALSPPSDPAQTGRTGTEPLRMDDPSHPNAREVRTLQAVLEGSGRYSPQEATQAAAGLVAAVHAENRLRSIDGAVMGGDGKVIMGESMTGGRAEMDPAQFKHQSVEQSGRMLAGQGMPAQEQQRGNQQQDVMPRQDSPVLVAQAEQEMSRGRAM